MTSPHQPFPPAPPVSARQDSRDVDQARAMLAELREVLAKAKNRKEGTQ